MKKKKVKPKIEIAEVEMTRTVGARCYGLCGGTHIVIVVPDDHPTPEHVAWLRDGDSAKSKIPLEWKPAIEAYEEKLKKEALKH